MDTPLRSLSPKAGNNEVVHDDPLLRIEDLRHLGVPFSKTSIYRKIKSGEFPAPIKLGPNTSAWLKSEVQAWKKAKIAQRESVAA